MLDFAAEQRHLAKLAAADPNKRFRRLYPLLFNENLIYCAWQDIAKNTGSKTPGLDGLTREDVDDKLLQTIANELKNQTYEPQPVKRVLIPKASGKLRPLGIPTIKDRIVQAAIKRVLEPIYEQDFLSCSYGFRPERNCYHAILQAFREYSAGVTWIIEGDIKGCYDNIEHGLLLEILRKRIADERLIELIRKFLKSGVVQDGKFYPTNLGTPQGNIVSPLLANIFLHELDKHLISLGANVKETQAERKARRNKTYDDLPVMIWRMKNLLSDPERNFDEETRARLTAKANLLVKKWKITPMYLPGKNMAYVRYADDFVIFLSQYSKTEAKELKANLYEWLHERLHLELSPEKTLITHWSDKIRFLGFDLQGIKTRTGHRSMQVSLPRTKVRTFRQTLKGVLNDSEAEPNEQIAKVNSKVRGWMNYYRVAHGPQRVFKHMVYNLFKDVARSMAARDGCSVRQAVKRHLVKTKGGRYVRIQKQSRSMMLSSRPPKTMPLYSVSKPPEGGLSSFKPVRAKVKRSKGASEKIE